MSDQMDSIGTNVVPLPVRRGSYLEAARAQGVYNLQEENLALSKAIRDLADKADELPAPVALRDHSPSVAQHGSELERQRAQIIGRFQAICKAYVDEGFAGEVFSFFTHVAFETSFTGPDAAELFQIVARYHFHGDQSKN